MVGFTNNKSSNQIAGPVFGQSPSVLGTKPTNIFSTLQTTGPIIWDQTKGTRIKPYECTTIQEAGKNVKYTSISAMSTYESKSHEELRWEDAELNSGGMLVSICVIFFKLIFPFVYFFEFLCPRCDQNIVCFSFRSAESSQ